MKEKFMQPGGILALKSIGISFTTGVGEIIDNAIEEDATQIVIWIRKTANQTYELIIIDNGNGMDKSTLQMALTFGGEGHGVKVKGLHEVGKYHVGMPLTMIRFSPVSTIYTKKLHSSLYSAHLSLEKLMKNGEIEEPVKIQAPSQHVQQLLNEEAEPQFDFQNQGTTIIFNELYPDLINDQNVNVEIEQLKQYIGERYFMPLEQKEVSIYLKINESPNVEAIEPASPLLINEQLLAQYGLALMGHYCYKDVLRVKELRPDAKVDGSLSIEFTIVQKINNSYKVNNVPKLFVLNQANQGIYITRNWKLLDSALDIGFKKHNSLNGMRALIRVDAAFDELLGIELNKSDHKITAEFENELGERIKDVIKHLRKMLNPKLGFFENPPAIIVGKEQRVIKPEIVKTFALKPIQLADNTNDKQNTTQPQQSKNEPAAQPRGQENTTVQLHKDAIIFAVVHEQSFMYNSFHHAMNVEVIRDDNSYLIYNEPLQTHAGITYSQLQAWWTKLGYNDMQLYEERIRHTLVTKGTSAHVLFYNLYAQYFFNKQKEKYALFPQMSVIQHIGADYHKQTVDFFIQLPNNEKIVIEIDAIQQYAEKKNKVWHASEPLYTLERKFDRKMLLKGYAVYHFTDLEVQQPAFKEQLLTFLDDLFEQ